MPYWPNWVNSLLLKLNVFGPLVYGRTYMKVRNCIDNGNTEEKLLNIVNHAIVHVPYYHNRYANLKIQTIDDFKRLIKPIDKDEVMAHWDEFVADDIDWTKCNIGATGGTSGKPLKLVTPKIRYAREMAFWHKCLKRYGWNYDTRAVLRNHHLPKERDFIISPILKEVIFDPFRMNDVYAKRVWEIMKEHKLRFIHAYPSAVFQFMKLCYRQGLDLSFIKACFLASEGVTPEQRTFIEGILKIEIFSFFGHSEKLIFAGSSPNDPSYEVEEHYGYLELMTENGDEITDKGEMGEMVGTTFFNKSFPLIRYRTGDYSSYTQNVNKKPRRLNGVHGRREKSLVYRMDGTTTSITAMNLHGEVYTHIDGLQYIQEVKGYIKLLVIKNELYTSTDEKELLENTGKAMGGRQFVEIEYVDHLIFQPNGKFLPLISKKQL